MLGHANPRKIYAYLKTKYFWETMREDTNKTIRTCKECLLFNDKNKDKGMYLLMIGEAFNRIGIDLKGSFQITEREKKYIVVAIDYLTKYVKIDLFNEKTAENVAEFIIQKIILRHGCLEKILSDNGKEFNTKMILFLCTRLKI